jgi:transcriptional regulator with XRE-family HTH domain
MVRKRGKPDAPWPERLAALRAALGLSMAGMAGRVGVSARTWYYLERGKRLPTRPVQILVALLEARVID